MSNAAAKSTILAALILTMIGAAPPRAVAQAIPAPAWLVTLEGKAGKGGTTSGSGISKGDIAILKAKANKGDADASFELADRYTLGDTINGITPDRAEAAKWWRKAAEQGNPDAQFNLANFYARGDAIDGIMPDRAEAAKWWRKAADQGNPDALDALERALEDPHYWAGSTRNHEEAYFWLNVDAKSGSKAAAAYLNQLGSFIEHGLTPEQISDIKKRASEWKPTPNPAYLASLQAKAAEGDRYAQYKLGVLYYLGGAGVTQNYEEAFFLLHVAAKGGLYEAVNSFDVLEPLFERHLTPEQISSIRKLASEWKPVPPPRPPPKVTAKATGASRCPQLQPPRRRLAKIDHAATGMVTFGAITPSECPITIPAGTGVQTDRGAIQYETTTDVVLPAGKRSVNAPVQALVAGSASNVHAGQLTQITLAIGGVDTVTNPASITNGMAGRAGGPSGGATEPDLAGPTIATGTISGLRSGGNPEMELRLRPQPNGSLHGELVIHQSDYEMTPIEGFVRSSRLQFQAPYGTETYYFQGQRRSDQISGTFESTPSGERGTWTVQKLSAATSP